MKKITLVLCVLFLLLLPVAVSAVGNITVNSVPTGATIILNGASTGFTTNTILENVSSGTNTILLQKSGYVDYTQTVSVIDNQTSIVSYSMVVATTSPIITSISPTSAANSGSQTIVITGSGFSGSTVTLTKSGQTTVSSSVVGTDSATSLSRNFNLNGIASGPWSLVILNSDGGTVSYAFTVNSATSSTVTTISPTSGVVNTSVSTTITGTGFVTSSAVIRLYRSGNYISGSVNSGGSTTQLLGTFSLYQAAPGSYDVCVLPDGTETSKICGPSFTILSTSSAANGSIYVKSSPSISKIFLNNVYQGYTPLTLDNIVPSTYTVMIRSAGYNDYSESVKVTAGNTSYVTASLQLTPDETTVTTVPKTTVSTVKTTKKSTAKTPTPWPTSTPTQSSSISILAILGIIGAGVIVLRKE